MESVCDQQTASICHLSSNIIVILNSSLQSNVFNDSNIFSKPERSFSCKQNLSFLVLCLKSHQSVSSTDSIKLWIKTFLENGIMQHWKKPEESLYIGGHSYSTYLPCPTVMALVCFQLLLHVQGLSCRLFVDEVFLAKGGWERGESGKEEVLSICVETNKQTNKYTKALLRNCWGSVLLEVQPIH